MVGEFSDGHGNFVAVVTPGTVDAVLQRFVRKSLLFDKAKVKVFEESRDAREETDTFDAAGFGMIEDGFYEQTAGSMSLGVGVDDDGAEFGKVLAVDVESGTADELVRSCFNDGECADVRADLRVTARQQGAVVGEGVD